MCIWCTVYVLWLYICMWYTVCASVVYVYMVHCICVEVVVYMYVVHYICICVGVVCVWCTVCVGVMVYMSWGGGVYRHTSGILLCHCCIPWRHPFTHLELGWAVRTPQQSPASTPHSRHTRPLLLFYMATEDLNSAPHACIVSYLIAEPSPQNPWHSLSKVAFGKFFLRLFLRMM